MPQVEITFTDFDLEDTPQCTNDYLDLGDKSSAANGRLCGSLLSETKSKIYSYTRNS